MKIKVEVDEAVLKVLVIEYIRERVNAPLVLTDLKIETKSKQNYRAEWESGAGFRATYEGEVP